MTTPDTTPIDVHLTTKDRLLAIADRLEAHPEEWKQSLWVEGIDRVQDAAGRGFCGTPGCIAGTGVMMSPPELFEGLHAGDWETAGKRALGLDDRLARMLFGGSYVPPDLPGVLRLLAELPEPRTTEAAVAAGLRYLSGAVLSGAVLSDADLSDAVLRDADLSDADLRDAVLRGADLSDADLRGADLSGAVLSYADLSGAVGNQFTRGLPSSWVVSESGFIVKAEKRAGAKCPTCGQVPS